MWCFLHRINSRYFIPTEKRISINKSLFSILVRYKSTGNIMKVLNVAEKNDAAKNIAGFLSRGNLRKRDGLSVYNKIYEFNVHLWNKDCQMIMTSVSGHLLGFEFLGSYRKWNGCHPLSLFDAPVVKECSDDNYVKIKKTIEREVRSCGALIIWTDCDREGENIGFEIIQVCQAIKPNIKIYRAKFSEITQISINRALQTLEQPNKLVSDAVDVRSELDLRIGAAFTRFQTLRLQQVFPSTLANMLISYGSCQFPTLGFVVERFLAIERFKSEPYWKIKVTDVRNNLTVEFKWSRVRLFDKLPCQIILDMCVENPDAKVIKVSRRPKSKWRPVPLDTIELEKQGSRKLRLSAKEIMRIAERLYTQGYISYPRTETNIFPKELNLVPLVDQQTQNPIWGQFAQNLLQDGLNPRQGKKSDNAHPPIHPTKYADSLQGNEAKVYEYVVRHFLACLSKNAEGQETLVEIDIAREQFLASGLHIIAKNYLEVYIYEKWSDKEIHEYQERQIFRPTSVDMVEEKTSPPSLLTEADLIALMDKHGIGTDATHADHIDTIKSRQYVGLTEGRYFMPGKLGIGLVMGYDNMGFQMSKPNLRAELEKDLQMICDGQKDPKVVLQSQINKYRDVFKVALERANLIDTALASYLDERPIQDTHVDIAVTSQDNPIFKCPKCNSNMVLRDRKQGSGKFISCMGYPSCTNAIWLPQGIESVEVLDEVCRNCRGNRRKLKFKIRVSIYPLFGPEYTTCIGGCDPEFNEAMNIKEENIRRTQQANDTGYNSGFNNSSESSQSTNRSNRPQTQNSTQQQARNRPTINNQNNRTAQSRQSGNSDVNESRQQHTNIVRPRTSVTQNNTVNNSVSTTSNGSMNGMIEMSNWGVIDENEIVVCGCNEQAMQLTVRKEGPNQGRLFYKCAKPQGTGCSFFLWHGSSENNAEQTSDRNDRRTAFPASTSRTTEEIICGCRHTANLLTVQKDGPNKGRQFYACPKGMNNGCNFFQWADVNPPSDNQNTNFGVFSRGNATNQRGKRRGRGIGNVGSTPKRSRVPGAKRKCGNCGIEGHTRKTCPENVMD